MKKYLVFLVALAFFLGLASAPMAGENAKAMKGGMKMEMKGIKGMSRDGLIKLAQSAAPLSISWEATILVPTEGGKLAEAKKGTNGFTCLPDISGQEEPDPICADPAATQWLMDLVNKKAKPTNAVPGIAYMAKGGWHWEKDGRIVDMGAPGANRVKEPPHWRVFWPFESRVTRLPDYPGKFKTYVMYDGTPYSHLMIYQNPNGISK
ncbi:MAG: hypothetical protein HZB83_04245 [Deltaproteobacteria bacterium]|nr:hypothetical protein [Deltaproteobacteria bacterium]